MTTVPQCTFFLFLLRIDSLYLILFIVYLHSRSFGSYLSIF
jgi:hypothetical protein